MAPLRPILNMVKYTLTGWVRVIVECIAPVVGEGLYAAVPAQDS